MSQNGPYPGASWPGESSDDEPYAQPADPWGEHAVSEPWSAAPSAIPQQPSSALHHTPPPSDNWGPPPAQPTKRNTAIVALVIVLGMLIATGLGVTGWLLWQQQQDRNEAKQPVALPSASTSPSATTPTSEDARFVKAGECVVNRGTNDEPDMHKSGCASGSYLVLHVFTGKTTGEADAESKCSRVQNYTNWFFYDSDFDELDVVLCLQKK